MAIATNEGSNYDLFSVPENSLVLGQAPVLSTPDFENFNDSSFQHVKSLNFKDKNVKNEEDLCRMYEIQQTAIKILEGQWKRVALQFPDDMLEDAWVVVSNLKKVIGQREIACKETYITKDNNVLKQGQINAPKDEQKKIYEVSWPEEISLETSTLKLENDDMVIGQLTRFKDKSDNILRAKFKDLGDGGLETDFNMSDIKNHKNVKDDEIIITVPKPTFKDLKDGGLETDITNLSISASTTKLNKHYDIEEDEVKFYILADTSYGSCCVDEIAAEHIDAQVIVHYGRSCLSPTTRLPVIYVFTSPLLDLDSIIQSFEEVFNEGDPKVILMADVTCHCHIKSIYMRLEKRGYTNLIAPEIVHNPASVIPNRLISSEINVKEYSLFHLSEPPPALLLTLNSRVKEMYICPMFPTASLHKSVKTTSVNLFRRRYGLLNSLNTCSTFGILINTLSVANHLHALDKIQALIKAAGRKYYTFVVGKVNAAKMANFSEVGGWVVIGCWESSLLDCKEFYRPVITPWELEWVLRSEKVRVWTGEWRGDFIGIGENIEECELNVNDDLTNSKNGREMFNWNGIDQLNSGTSVSSESNSESESEPPQFDLRTGRYVSHSRPMQKSKAKKSQVFSKQSNASEALSQRHKGILATIGGEVSTGAEFLRSDRTWTGLGSDFREDVQTELEIGRTGVARGYMSNGKMT